MHIVQHMVYWQASKGHKSLFFQDRFFKGGVGVRFSREMNERIFQVSPRSLILRFHSVAPGLLSGLLERSWPLYKYGLFCSLKYTEVVNIVL